MRLPMIYSVKHTSRTEYCGGSSIPSQDYDLWTKTTNIAKQTEAFTQDINAAFRYQVVLGEGYIVVETK